MGTLHTAARGIVAQFGEVDVQVVVGRLVVQINSQLGGRKAIALQDGHLNNSASGTVSQCCCGNE